jgi:hypothetical protein
VRIRRRKPCTLCRRRLFGWYVRLLTRVIFRVGNGRNRGGPGGQAPTPRPDRPPARMRRGHAAPVGSGPTAQRYGLAGTRVKPSDLTPRGPPARATLRCLVPRPTPDPSARACPRLGRLPVDNRLIHRPRPC